MAQLLSTHRFNPTTSTFSFNNKKQLTSFLFNHAKKAALFKTQRDYIKNAEDTLNRGLTDTEKNLLITEARDQYGHKKDNMWKQTSRLIGYYHLCDKCSSQVKEGNNIIFKNTHGSIGLCDLCNKHTRLNSVYAETLSDDIAVDQGGNILKPGDEVRQQDTTFTIEQIDVTNTPTVTGNLNNQKFTTFANTVVKTVCDKKPKKKRKKAVNEKIIQFLEEAINEAQQLNTISSSAKDWAGHFMNEFTKVKSPQEFLGKWTNSLGVVMRAIELKDENPGLSELKALQQASVELKNRPELESELEDKARELGDSITGGGQLPDLESSRKASIVKEAPANIADEDIWEKAKKQVDKDKYKGDSYWAVVQKVYQNMGGTYKGKKSSLNMKKTAGTVPGIPDGTGPYGRGMGPGQGRGDGTGMLLWRQPFRPTTDNTEITFICPQCGYRQSYTPERTNIPFNCPKCNIPMTRQDLLETMSKHSQNKDAALFISMPEEDDTLSEGSNIQFISGENKGLAGEIIEKINNEYIIETENGDRVTAGIAEIKKASKKNAQEEILKLGTEVRVEGDPSVGIPSWSGIVKGYSQKDEAYWIEDVEHPGEEEYMDLLTRKQFMTDQELEAEEQEETFIQESQGSIPNKRSTYYPIGEQKFITNKKLRQHNVRPERGRYYTDNTGTWKLIEPGQQAPAPGAWSQPGWYAERWSSKENINKKQSVKNPNYIYKGEAEYPDNPMPTAEESNQPWAIDKDLMDRKKKYLQKRKKAEVNLEPAEIIRDKFKGTSEDLAEAAEVADDTVDTASSLNLDIQDAEEAGDETTVKDFEEKAQDVIKGLKQPTEYTIEQAEMNLQDVKNQTNKLTSVKVLHNTDSSRDFTGRFIKVVNGSKIIEGSKTGTQYNENDLMASGYVIKFAEGTETEELAKAMVYHHKKDIEEALEKGETEYLDEGLEDMEVYVNVAEDVNPLLGEQLREEYINSKQQIDKAKQYQETEANSLKSGDDVIFTDEIKEEDNVIACKGAAGSIISMGDKNILLRNLSNNTEFLINKESKKVLRKAGADSRSDFSKIGGSREDII